MDNVVLVVITLGFIVIAAVLLEITAVGKRVTAAGLVLLISILLSNVGLIPLQSPVYGKIVQYCVPMAISLLLLKASVIRIFRETGGVGKLFLLGVVLTIVGTLVGISLVDVGPEESKLAATFAATFIGGSMNFVAVATAVEFENTMLLSAALAADNLTGSLYIVVLASMSASSWFINRCHKSQSMVASVDISEQESESLSFIQKLQSISLKHLAAVLLISAFVVTLSHWSASTVDLEKYSILLVTILTVMIASFFPCYLSDLKGDVEIGTLLMYLFFAVIGASTNLTSVITNAPTIIVFAAIIIVVHTLSIFTCAWVLKFDFAETITASMACITGPSVAAALAASRGWNHLVTPAIICGFAGYILANFIGLSLEYMLNQLGSGL